MMMISGGSPLNDWYTANYKAAVWLDYTFTAAPTYREHKEQQIPIDRIRINIDFNIKNANMSVVIFYYQKCTNVAISEIQF